MFRTMDVITESSMRTIFFVAPRSVLLITHFYNRLDDFQVPVSLQLNDLQLIVEWQAPIHEHRCLSSRSQSQRTIDFPAAARLL